MAEIVKIVKDDMALPCFEDMPEQVPFLCSCSYPAYPEVPFLCSCSMYMHASAPSPLHGTEPCPVQVLRVVCQSMSCREFDPAERVTKQAEAADAFYIILQGQADVWVKRSYAPSEKQRWPEQPSANLCISHGDIWALKCAGTCHARTFSGILLCGMPIGLHLCATELQIGPHSMPQ